MNTVYLKDFITGTGDATQAVLRALEACKATGADTLEIEKGEYHFYPDFAFEKYYFISNNDHGLKRVAFPVLGFNGLTINLNGSELIFHGRMTPFIVEDSTNITIKGCSIDYERPFFAQGEILDYDESHMDIRIDKEAYPYKFADNKIVFYSDNWKMERVNNFLEVDKDTNHPAYLAGDNWADIFVYAEEISDGVVRFHSRFNNNHKVGNTMVISHEGRNNPGVFADKTKGLTLKDINIYHADAMGVILQNTCDIVLDNVNVKPRPGSGRAISAIADATHFVNCYGSLVVENCTFENQKDDPLNCHGIYTTVEAMPAANEIIVLFHHEQQVGIGIYEPGDEITFINRKSLLGYATAEVKETVWLNNQYLRVILKDAVPASVQMHDAVENRDRMPELTVRNCSFGHNRARGLLITTPKKVVVENNNIYSPGAGILIEGDANYWFESGADNDVTIRNNTFNDGLYSVWGEALIQATPGVSRDEKYEECFHRNITIESNTFNTFDKSVLFINSVDGLKFVNNTINQTDTYKPHTRTEAILNLNICKNVEIKGNKVNGFENENFLSQKLCDNVTVE